MQPIEKCKTCGALPGQYCVTDSGKRAKVPHSGFRGTPVRKRVKPDVSILCPTCKRTKQDVTGGGLGFCENEFHNPRVQPVFLQSVRTSVEEVKSVPIAVPQQRPEPARVTSVGIADPERYRRATFYFAKACKEVLAAQEHIGTGGVAKTALIDLEHGLRMVSKFKFVPAVKSYESLEDVS